ncbi:c-type cytochrome [Dongia soli]|uniref:Cytochrome c n=1 Tax=Dongia soli TaxID=600628 RepID=A0ABU5EB18_9PROT|nr:cytochrome c [Dongia soli]MDY0882723.1 cytochrome c [Dongia soli]
MLKRILSLVILLAALSMHVALAEDGRQLTLTIGQETRHFTRDVLLSRPDTKTVSIARDIAYGKPMTFRAVPLARLLEGLTLPPDYVLEAVASDGFATQLPLDLVTNSDPTKAVAYVAIEDPAKPWPALPNKKVSAGPFYIVWLGDGAASVRSEQWPYQVISLTTQEAPAKRWPALAVDAALPATDPVRAGQTLFVTQCMACHKLNRAGSADVGPDLNLPMNPTEYFQPAALERYIRDPASVRHWPEQKMPAFDQANLSDREIALIIRYLGYMASRKVK